MSEGDAGLDGDDMSTIETPKSRAIKEAKKVAKRVAAKTSKTKEAGRRTIFNYTGLKEDDYLSFVRPKIDEVILDLGFVHVVTSEEVRKAFDEWWKKVKAEDKNFTVTVSRDNGIGTAVTVSVIVMGKKKIKTFNLTAYGWW